MKDDGKIDSFEFLVLAFTVYILISLGLQMFVNLDPEITKILMFFDLVSSIFFIIDWIGRYREAQKKLKFTLYNSLDLIASLPLIFIFGELGFTRIFKLLQIVRLFKIAGAINRLHYYSSRNNFDHLKSIVSFFILTIVITGPIAILVAERGSGNIKTAEQALWWTYCTFTTIGYGDFYPSTTYGRLLAVLVSLGGIAMFGLLSSIIINYFTTNVKKDDNS